MFFYQTVIQETYLDVFGHMNNARYLELFEQARWQIITQNGFGLEKIKETSQGPVILEVNLKFLKELYARTRVQISVECTDYNGKIGKLKQQMLNDKNEVCAELTVVFGLFDLKARKLITPSDDWKKAIGI